MMDYSAYENKLPYPQRPDRPRLNTVTCTSVEAMSYAASLAVWEKAMEEYRESMAVRKAETKDLMRKFKEDAIENAGLKGHPKADDAFDRAWEMHSEGLYAVFQELENLATLLWSE